MKKIGFLLHLVAVQITSLLSSSLNDDNFKCRLITGSKNIITNNSVTLINLDVTEDEYNKYNNNIQCNAMFIMEKSHILLLLDCCGKSGNYTEFNTKITWPNNRLFQIRLEISFCNFIILFPPLPQHFEKQEQEQYNDSKIIFLLLKHLHFIINNTNNYNKSILNTYNNNCSLISSSTIEEYSLIESFYLNFNKSNNISNIIIFKDNLNGFYIFSIIIYLIFIFCVLFGTFLYCIIQYRNSNNVFKNLKRKK